MILGDIINSKQCMMIPEASQLKAVAHSESHYVKRSIGLTMELGYQVFITINPADVFHPLIMFLVGTDINIDNLLHKDIPNH
jgi:hypothetical protein